MSENNFYPKWIFHKTEEAKIVQNKEEHEAAGKDWAEKPFDAEEIESKKSELTEENLIAMKVAELKELLILKGKTEDELKGLKKDDLIAMFGSL